jgi:hypothetical protein
MYNKLYMWAPQAGDKHRGGLEHGDIIKLIIYLNNLSFSKMVRLSGRRDPISMKHF